MQHPVDTSRTGASIDAAEIVRATKITTAQASPVTHYRSRSRSSFSAEDSPQPSSVASLSSSRIMPSPIPPPCAALPPTPGTSSTPGAGASPILGGKAHRNARGVKTSLRNDLRLNVGLTQEEHVELVHKILADLRPAHIGAMVRTNSCVLSPATTIASAAHQRLAANKMSLRNSVEKRHSASSQSDDCVSKVSVSTTPQLSQSRTPTPTTPGLEAAAAEVKTDKTAEGDAEKALLTPTAALESLRVLENSFQRSSVHLPREESTTQESKLSSPTTAVAPSPTRSTIDDKETAASGARGKRNSSYRKSVPTPNQLDTSVDALGISGASSPSPSSPSSATVTTEPSWISSLTAFEAIRVLAFQQDVAKALAPETDAAAAAGATPTETTADEVSALRYALKFAIARADRLAEALNRASDERVKVESELEILRRNVLSMLGTRNMFGGGEAVVRRGGGRRAAAEEVVVEEEDDEEFEDATEQVEQQAPRRKQQQQQQKQQQRSVDVKPRVSSSSSTTTTTTTTTTTPAEPRPTRARQALTTEPAPSKPTAPTGSVSIASLRAKTTASSSSTTTAVASPASQRYAPPRKALNTTTTTDTTTTSSEDEEFDMFPFAKPTRKNASEVSMTDFLNASRMSKIEIEQHDARRELERSLDDTASTHSRLALNGSGFVNRRGLFKSLTKMVVDQKGAGRRQSAGLVPTTVAVAVVGGMERRTPLKRSPSEGGRGRGRGRGEEVGVAFGDTIIPTYPGSVGRKKAEGGLKSSMSLNGSLRESLERHGLREAGIRT